MHRFLSTVPFDLYQLALFHLVVKHRSFTKAAQIAGLTQSAITRQMQAIESSLEIQLLERTTRSVKVTTAGDYVFHEAARLLGDVEHTLDHLAREFGHAKREVRVAVSRSVGLAYLPGFFHANLRRAPAVGYRVTSESSGQILNALEANETDLGVLCPPARLPKTLRITHRFKDAFTFVAPAELAWELGLIKKPKAKSDWMAKQNWLLIDEATNTGRALRGWMRRQGWKIEPAMQLDNFDLIINLVALGLGVSIVPIRALALYGRKRHLRRVDIKSRFERELVVVARKSRKTPEHLEQFIENVLF